ncbi:glycerate kinase [Streptomyces sp. NPDC057002]|uniref:glycerate kinase n=1 Tax=Streptomyces sp. NPDC057002 TaxID=3345992 RepID=UPI003639131D
MRELDDALTGFVRLLAAEGVPDAARHAEAPGAGAAGGLDEQSMAGKLPVALARRARRYGTEVHAVAGRCTLPAERTAAHFRSVQALTELTDQDCAHDGDLSAASEGREGRERTETAR